MTTRQEARMLEHAEREHREREQARIAAADQAMRRHGQTVGMFCNNLLAGRDGLAGIGQFMERDE